MSYMDMTKACDICGLVVDVSEMSQIIRNGKTRYFCDRHEVTSYPSGEIKSTDIDRP